MHTLTVHRGLGASPREQRQNRTALVQARPDPAVERWLSIQRTYGNRAACAWADQSLNDLGKSLRAGIGNSARGAPLREGTRRELEAGLEAELPEIRIHNDAVADQLCRSADATAFTCGRDIYFREGKFHPDSPDGLRLLAHEAAHVTQQLQGPVPGWLIGSVRISETGDALENAAESAAEKVVSGRSPLSFARKSSAPDWSSRDSGPSSSDRGNHASIQRDEDEGWLSGLGSLVESAGSAIASGAGAAWDLGSSAIRDAGSSIAEGAGAVWNAGSELVGEAGSTIASGAGAALDYGSSVVQDVGSNIASGAGAVWNAGSELVGDAGSAIASGARTVWNTGSEVASGIHSGMRQAGRMVRGAEHWAEGGIDRLMGLEKDSLNWMAGAAEGIPVLEQLAGGAAWLGGLNADITGGILKGATHLVGGVAGMAVNPVDTAIGLEGLAEHVRIMPGMANPLQVMHGLYNVVANDADFGREMDRTLNPLSIMEGDYNTGKALVTGIAQPYMDAYHRGNYGEMVGRGAFDIGMLLLGAGEAGAAAEGAGAMSAASELGMAAEGAEAMGALGELGAAAEGAEALSAMGELGAAAEGAEAMEAVGQLGRVAEGGEASGALATLGEATEGSGALSEASALEEAAGVSQSGGLRTANQEFQEFLDMLREEGATGEFGAGEPVTLIPHAGAREARQLLNVTGDAVQSAHGLPQSVGRNIPGYNPNAALTTLEETAIHTGMDQGWKTAFQQMRRQGETTATAQEIYNTVGQSIQGSQLPQGVIDTLRLRLQDEMLEWGLGLDDVLPLPYRNIRPR